MIELILMLYFFFLPIFYSSSLFYIIFLETQVNATEKAKLTFELEQLKKALSEVQRSNSSAQIDGVSVYPIIEKKIDTIERESQTDSIQVVHTVFNDNVAQTDEISPKELKNVCMQTDPNNNQTSEDASKEKLSNPMDSIDWNRLKKMPEFLVEVEKAAQTLDIQSNDRHQFQQVTF